MSTPSLVRLLRVLASALALPALFGCPGADPLAAGNPVPGANVVALSTADARPATPGDTWTYDFRSRFTQSGVEGFSLWAGTRRNFVNQTTDPTYGTVLAFNYAAERAIIEGLGVGTAEVNNAQDRFAVDEDLEMCLVARMFNGALSYVISPAGGAPANRDHHADIGDTWSTGDIVFDDGSVLTHNQVISGIETVTVPLGTFETYRVDFSATATWNGAATTEVGTMWVVPALGAEVRLELIRQWPLSDGGTWIEELTTELTSTNVPF